MCGICGTTNEADIEGMIKALTHRGPDMAGRTTKKPLVLGHTRLSIIDTSTKGRQPMKHKDLTLSFNGEIYNYKTLAKKYLQGVKRKTDTDSEVLLHLWHKHGEKCLAWLEGMWAFAIYNETEQTITFCTDRFGKKPLYYKHNHPHLSFASEAKAINTNCTTDTDAIQLYLDYGYIPAPYTAWKEIKKLRPATLHTINLKTGEKQTKTWWKPTQKQYLLSYEQAQQHIRKLLEKSVKDRFVADVPVGCFLSGGVDSSIISSIAHKYKQQKGEQLNTFSIAFENAQYDESGYARQVAEHLGTAHHEETVTIADLKKTFTHIKTLYDEPYADSSALPTYLVSKVARKKVTVALSGDGGDELFGGYRTYNHWMRGNILNKTPLKALLPKKYRGDAQQLYNGLLGSHNNNYVFDGAFTNKAQNWVSRLTKADLAHYLPFDILTKVDRASMAHALEVRSPILQHTLADFAISLPARFKIQQTVPLLTFSNKRALKDAYRADLPSHVFDRKKMGFSIPQQELIEELGEQTIDWQQIGIDKKPTPVTTYRELVLNNWIQ